MKKIQTMKTYIGDSVYVEIDSYEEVVLTTENGITISNRIVLEKRVWQDLVKFVNSVKEILDELERTSDQENGE